jgi:glycosyltransferase involved in cell wall biosynthesis
VRAVEERSRAQPADQPNLFYFGWPSYYGGADTKADHLFRLLCADFDITVVPNLRWQLEQRDWTSYFDHLGIRYLAREDLPSRLEGVALSLCNDTFFTDGICEDAKSRGLKTVWSAEMAWSHPGERVAISAGLIDRLLYVSDVQKRALDYESYCDVPTRITGNYIDPDAFPFHQRDAAQLTIGRLSRADPAKFPADFPTFYEQLQIPGTRFRVMAWSRQLDELYRWHTFDDRWDLLAPMAETQLNFLRSLDLFVYPLGPDVTESWGRSTVEAMLTGAIPLVPDGHNFAQLILHGDTGFICSDFEEYQKHAQELAADREYRHEMSRACHEHAVNKICNREEHRKIWVEALDV